MEPLPRYVAAGTEGLIWADELAVLPDPPPERGIVVERDGDGRLAVRVLGRPGTGITVDLRGEAIARRVREGKRGLLGRAVGLAGGEIPVVWDLTAGLGRDAACLAALGAKVFAFERDPVLLDLLIDALVRAATPEGAPPRGARSLPLFVPGDAMAVLRSAAEWIELRGEAPPWLPDAILIDPMFPHRGSALAKKEAQLLQALLGEGGNPEEDARLFAAARALRPRRIVVKRPRVAPAIVPEPEPAHRFVGKSVRYDLYLP